MVVALAALGLSACGSSTSSSTHSAASSSTHSAAGSTGAGKQIRVGLAQSGSQNDGSFGQEAHDGAVLAERDFGVKLTEVDNLVTPQEQLAALENLARTSNLVLMDASVPPEGIYERYPRAVFVSIAGALPTAKNTRSTVEDWYPVSYLAGVAAAHATKHKVIGFVGGTPVPVVRSAAQGYTLGAKSVDPSIRVLVSYTGSFTDATEAKSAAQAQIDDGADVLYADLDTAHAGVVEAAKVVGAKVIGSVAPKCSISQGTDIGDTLFNEEGVVFQLIHKYVEGDLTPVTDVGLGNNVSAFMPCPGDPAAVTAAIAKARQAILDGQVKLPVPASGG
jgi:basic membrane protein A